MKICLDVDFLVRGEGEKTFLEFDPDFASFSVYEPFPGTELFNIGIEKGLVQEERSLEDFYTISPKYYYVKDMNRRVDAMSNEEFEQIENDVKKEFHKFNRKPSKILQRPKLSDFFIMTLLIKEF